MRSILEHGAVMRLGVHTELAELTIAQADLKVVDRLTRSLARDAQLVPALALRSDDALQSLAPLAQERLDVDGGSGSRALGDAAVRAKREDGYVTDTRRFREANEYVGHGVFERERGEIELFRVVLVRSCCVTRK